eukprot:scaffold95477_cov34-Tisochrysis_lutea.AAC.1
MDVWPLTSALSCHPRPSQESNSVGLATGAAIYGIFYFGICIRIMWSELFGIVQFCHRKSRTPLPRHSRRDTACGGIGDEAMCSATQSLRSAEAPGAGVVASVLDQSLPRASSSHH